MLKKAIILTTLLLSFTTAALAEPQWRYKPIQCSTPKEILEVLIKMGSKPLVGGLSIITDGTNYANTPMVMYYNIETNDFQIIEFHSKNTACMVATGGDVSFDIEELSKNLKKHFTE